jgi:hypothetical protein
MSATDGGRRGGRHGETRGDTGGHGGTRGDTGGHGGTRGDTGGHGGHATHKFVSFEDQWTLTPSLEMMCPRYSISVWPKWHLVSFSLSPDF